MVSTGQLLLFPIPFITIRRIPVTTTVLKMMENINPGFKLEAEPKFSEKEDEISISNKCIYYIKIIVHKNILFI